MFNELCHFTRNNTSYIHHCKVHGDLHLYTGVENFLTPVQVCTGFFSDEFNTSNKLNKVPPSHD